MYGELWVITWDDLVNIVPGMINLSSEKKALLSKGIKSDAYIIRLSICTFKSSQLI